MSAPFSYTITSLMMYQEVNAIIESRYPGHLDAQPRIAERSDAVKRNKEVTVCSDHGGTWTRKSNFFIDLAVRGYKSLQMMRSR